jgi:hypothetical protein
MLFTVCERARNLCRNSVSAALGFARVVDAGVGRCPVSFLRLSCCLPNAQNS